MRQHTLRDPSCGSDCRTASQPADRKKSDHTQEERNITSLVSSKFHIFGTRIEACHQLNGSQSFETRRMID